MKKLIATVASAAVVAPVSVLAAAADYTALETAMTDEITVIKTVMISIAGAGVVIGLFLLGVRLIRRTLFSTAR